MDYTGLAFVKAKLVREIKIVPLCDRSRNVVAPFAFESRNANETKLFPDVKKDEK
jgi:hypothetical protein